MINPKVPASSWVAAKNAKSEENNCFQMVTNLQGQRRTEDLCCCLKIAM